MSQDPSIRQIIRVIDDHLESRGGPYSAWYCGIAADPRDRLFNDHNVSEEDGKWIYRNCGSDMAARVVEAHFLELGCQGGDGGGSRSTTSVYAYRVTATTVEEA
jgi:hypothetical protein